MVHVDRDREEREVRYFVHRLAGRHCRRIADALHSRGVSLDKAIDEVIEENNETVFDAQKMLLDWLHDQDCSNLEKREKLQNAAMFVRRKDWTTNEHGIFGNVHTCIISII